jgi:hypothetical protein
MLFNVRTSWIIRLVLILILLVEMLAVVPVQAASLEPNQTKEQTETIQQQVEEPYFLHASENDNVFPTVVTSIPQHGDVLSSGPSSVTTQFSADMLADGTAFAVNRTANYLLVEDGADGKFQTTLCAKKLGGDDTNIPLNTVSYDSVSHSSVLTVNGGIALGAGSYQLLVCGSTRIDDT